MDVRSYNRDAWDRAVAEGDRWTRPVGPEAVARARRGDWSVLLTPTRAVPRAWLGDLAGRDLLGLASAGGQQAPLFAAAGARVTVLDASPAQLGQDRLVAEREGLEIALVEGDMADLSAFAAASFDLVFHPCSNCFAPDVRPVWREVARVLRPGGALLAGFCNPVQYLVDRDAGEDLALRYPAPFASPTSLSPAELERLHAAGEPYEFGHSLADQIGGQCAAGLHVVALYEDRWGDDALDRWFPSFLATRAVKPR